MSCSVQHHTGVAVEFALSEQETVVEFADDSLLRRQFVMCSEDRLLFGPHWSFNNSMVVVRVGVDVRAIGSGAPRGQARPVLENVDPRVILNSDEIQIARGSRTHYQYHLHILHGLYDKKVHTMTSSVLGSCVSRVAY